MYNKSAHLKECSFLSLTVSLRKKKPTEIYIALFYFQLIHIFYNGNKYPFKVVLNVTYFPTLSPQIYICGTLKDFGKTVKATKIKKMNEKKLLFIFKSTCSQTLLRYIYFKKKLGSTFFHSNLRCFMRDEWTKPSRQ